MKEYVKRNRKIYDALAVKYCERIMHKSPCEIDFGRLVDYMTRHYVELYGSAPQKVLELGPGAGEVIRTFDERGCYTAAIELSTKMAEVAKKNSPHTVFLLHDILSFHDFLQEQFDIVFAGAFLHLFPLEDEERILRKIRKWMSGESLFCLYTTIHAVSEEGIFPKDDYGAHIEHFRRRWNRNDLCSFLTANGFEIIASFENYEADRNKQWFNLLLKKV